MSETTKTCNLTEDELNRLIGMHGCNLGNKDTDTRIERINYLNKRLKAFKEVEMKPDAQFAADAKGWGNQNGN